MRRMLREEQEDIQRREEKSGVVQGRFGSRRGRVWLVWEHEWPPVDEEVRTLLSYPTFCLESNFGSPCIVCACTK